MAKAGDALGDVDAVWLGSFDASGSTTRPRARYTRDTSDPVNIRMMLDMDEKRVARGIDVNLCRLG